MRSIASSALLVACLSYIAPASAVFNPSIQTNLGVYWGSNAYGDSGDKAQKDLIDYCADTNIDIIPLAFVNKINGQGGQPELNFANSGWSCTIFPGTNLWNCPKIGQDITTCQQQYGKTILLSIGGGAATESGFPNADNATNSANLMWSTFGPYNPSSTALRPFGSAVIDGFDIDIEKPTNNYVAWTNRIRTLMSADTSGRKWFMTASPQCPFPDANIGALLNGSSFDALFIQYYNNPACETTAFVKGATTQTKFNYAQWDTWAKNTSKNKAVKLFMAVLGGPRPPTSSATESGYMGSANLEPIIKYCKTFASFGGVIIWDVSRAYANPPIVANIKLKLTAAALKTRSRLFRA